MHTPLATSFGILSGTSKHFDPPNAFRLPLTVRLHLGHNPVSSEKCSSLFVALEVMFSCVALLVAFVIVASLNYVCYHREVTGL
jgi:hypothetical protein